MTTKMIKLTLLLILSGLISWVSFSSNKDNHLEWQLVWMDNFNRNEIDDDVWNFMDRRCNTSWKYHTSNPKCYLINNEGLLLRGIQNPNHQTDTAKFLTGGVYTKYKKAFPPGKIEIRAKFNSIKGTSVALWLMPYSPENGWPYDGEIDIMEHSGTSDYITQTVHSGYTKKNPNASPQRYTKEFINTNEYNIYSVEILEDKIVFCVNGKKTLSYPRLDIDTSEGQFPFYRDWYLLMNVNIGANPNVHIDTTELPVEMQIDWVKYYRKKQQ